MKTIAAAGILVLIIALFLPLLLSSPPPEVSETPSPTMASAVTADAELSFTVSEDGNIRVVTMAEWLPGVLAGEMPALFESEALRAQAVAARTYIMHRMEHTTASHPDAAVCNNPNCCKAHIDDAALREKWENKYSAYLRKMTDAAESTDGQYLSYEGEPIQALFHSSSAGLTEDAEAVWSALPYLVSVASPETAEDVPNFVSTVELTPESLKATMLAEYPEAELSGEPSGWLGELALDSSGRVGMLTLGGVEVAGTKVRTLFSLRSTAFSLEYTDGMFVFTVTGFGHGVGMSQFGANVMAEGGADYAEILEHYYPGTELVAVLKTEK